MTSIIRVMQNIEFTTSPDSTTITPENIGETIDQMARESPIICSLVSNIVRIQTLSTN